MSIQLKEISKSFDDILLYHKLNAEIRENRVTCIMGPSGSGKTTLTYLLMGLVKQDYGRIDGLDGKRITAVFQEDRLCENIDAVKNVLLVCDRKTVRSQVEQEFREVGLTDYNGKPAAELSGGMKRRVAIVRALLPDSDIVIMDEPFKGLDEELKLRVINYVKSRIEGKTVILITHDKEEAEALSADYLYL